MRSEVRQDILMVLQRAVHYISRNNILKLAELSNHTIHNASIFQDEDSVSVAVIIYALSKIFEREHGLADKTVVDELNKAHTYLSKNDFAGYKQTIHKLSKLIAGLDNKMRLYIEEVINQAQIRKGSKIYEHGISLARASEMLGISQWELMSYVGKTQIVDRAEKAPKVVQRLGYARRLFNL